MKKVATVLFIVLLAWNIFLTVQIVILNKKETTIENTTVIKKSATDIKSELTDLVKKSEDKVVTIMTMTFGQTTSTGSGAIYKVDGKTAFVITNNHVIESGDDITVTFANGSEKKAVVVGKDAISDLALLKVETDFTPEAFTLGDSALTKKGEYVIAMGSPLGIEYRGSVSYGVISGIDRSLEIDVDNNGVGDWDMLVLQTDAAINPGNSGGPLINMAGELIGINSLKISNEEVEGFGFAIPANEVITIITQLEKDGKVLRPIMGISGTAISDLTTYEKSRYKINPEIKAGLYLTKVIEDGPAEKAGLVRGDVIIAFDGHEITTFKQFRQRLYEKKNGEEVTIEFIRQGKKAKTTVTLS